MLFCLSEKKVGFVVEFLYYNILREGAVFKRVCARARDFLRKKTKIAGNGLSGRFEVVFEYWKFAKEV